MHYAVRENDMEAARWLIANGADVNAKNGIDWTPLYLAAAAEVAKLLIDNGAEVNVSARRYGWTPLHWAAKKGAAEVAKVQQQRGGQCERRGRRNAFG